MTVCDTHQHRSARLRQWCGIKRLLVLASEALLLLPHPSQSFVQPVFFCVRPSARNVPDRRFTTTISSLVHKKKASDREQEIKTRLFGISEWRDTFFDFPGTGDDRRLGTETGGPPKKVNLLPFPFQEVLLQGETKQLRLYEERFLKLFEDSMDKHGGVVAMGLLADSGIIQTVPLCEIEAYNRMEGFGIFVTIRVRARAAFRYADMLKIPPHSHSVSPDVWLPFPTSFRSSDALTCWKLRSKNPLFRPSLRSWQIDCPPIWNCEW